MTITSSPARPGTTSDTTSTTRIRVVAAALAVAGVTVSALLLSTPWGDRYDSGADEVISYDNLLSVSGGAWTGMLVNGLAFAVLNLSLGLVVCHLVRGRGRLAASLGALLATLGGTLSAMGGLSFATLTWFASSVPEDVGRPLVDHANDSPGHLLGATVAGFLLSHLGQLALATALWRARVVPTAGVAVYVLLVLTQFAGLPGRALDLLQVAMMALCVALAMAVLRRPMT